MNIYIAGIPSSYGKGELRKLFEDYGSVQTAKIIIDRGTGLSRCFGFVEMPDEAEARKAIEKLSVELLEGKQLKVCEAVPKN